MLNIQNVSITYGNNLTPTVEGVNLEMKQGEIVSIVGESGSGKSTVIRAVLGCLPGGGRVSRGNILYEGRSLLKKTDKQIEQEENIYAETGKKQAELQNASMTEEQREQQALAILKEQNTALRRLQIPSRGEQKKLDEEWRKLRGTEMSMIFQDSGAMINPVRRIGAQYVEYIRAHENISKKDAFDKGVEMLERMRLPSGDNIMRSYPFQLSGGMRQRVGIAMAMTFQPKLLLGDEPTSALDVTTQAQIVRQMMELREKYNTSIIVVTHNIGVAAYMADKIIVMKDGRIVDSGDRDKILNDPSCEYTKNLLASVPAMGGYRFV